MNEKEKDEFNDWLIDREDCIKGFETKKEKQAREIMNLINQLDMNSKDTTIILNFIHSLLDFYIRGEKSE